MRGIVGAWYFSYMNSYPVEPKHGWVIGAILAALLLVVGTITVVFAASYPEAAEVKEPPRGILIYGDESQVGCSGAAGCPGGAREIEVFKINAPIPVDAVVVAEDSTMVFDYGADLAEGSPYCEVTSLDSNAGFSLNCRRVGERLEVPANLPPGEYGLAVSVTNEEGDGGDFYGFHLLVENDG